MTPEIRRAALRAAARLALSSLVVGCGSASSASGENGVQSDQSDLSSGHCHEDAGSPAEQAQQYCAENDPDNSIGDCCKAEIKSANLPSDLQWGPDPDPRVDDVTRGCCQTLAARADERAAFNDVRVTCCATLGWTGTPACTPWGPPMPPAMDWVPGSAERAVSQVLAA